MNIPLWKLDWPKLERPYCNIYIVAAEGRWPIKIGIAVAAAKRLSSLQTSHWKPLQIVSVWWCEDSAKARRVEKKAHALLVEARLSGEWFDRTIEQAADVINFAAMTENVELNEHIPDDVLPLLGKLQATMERQGHEYRVAETMAWRTGDSKYVREFARLKPRGLDNKI
jgi:hypothetical protein